ncbi:MAG: hypothetical protein HYV28_03660, partial [Ignavibacteriales bacterium]|nr:hypothetical protein [Ignavibacteriales bacterium]
MKLLKLFSVFVLTTLLAPGISGQTNFLSFISYVNSLQGSAKATAVDSFVNYHRSRRVPVIEDNYTIFIYNGAVNSAAVSGDFNGWGSLLQMTKVSGTNFYYYSRTFEPNARLDYKIILNGSNWILDPLNANTVSGGFGPNSELAMPAYVQPWEIKAYPQTKQGSVITTSLYSTSMSTTYQIKIYLPFGYNTTSKRYRSVYFQDGYEYVDLASAVNVLDNLIDSNKITEVIGIFVKPNNRNEEYAGSTRIKYQQFFVNELVPWVDANYRTFAMAENRLVLGDSYGANISALISYNYADVFGNCGLHSSAFQPNNFEAMTLIMGGIKKNIKYSAVWGTYESVYEMMRPFRDSVIAKGYSMAWMELPEGHSWGLWRASIDYLLMNIFPYTPNSITHEGKGIPEKLALEQNYPNP